MAIAATTAITATVATSLFLAACIATGGSLGVCRAEAILGTDILATPYPQWASEEWVEFAAHIVASEAAGVPEARIVVACTMVRDVERGWHPWALRKRWFGWGWPSAGDFAAVRSALNGVNGKYGECYKIPSYKYVGNLRDAQHWRRTGVIGSGPYDLYVGPTGNTVVGVPW